MKNMILTIIALSAIMWYIIDRAKTELWEGTKGAKWATIAAAAAFGSALVFTYGLDLLFAAGVTLEVTVTGKVITVLALMSGSSAVAEIIGRIKGGESDGEH